MTLLLLLILLIMFFLLRTFNFRKTKFVVMTSILLLVILITTGVIPKFLLDELQQDYAQKPTIQWQDNNAIVLLGAGIEKIEGRFEHRIENSLEPSFYAYGRIYEAARLYNECMSEQGQCKIIVTGGDTHKFGDTEAAVYKKSLIHIGINAKDIIVESKSLNTWQNAQFTSAILNEQQFDNTVLVSSGLHIKRSQLYFSHFGIKATPIRSDYLSAKLSYIPLGYNVTMTDFALHEWLGFIRYDIYNMIGANQKRVNAGDA
ncbi:MAG: YdcF family protein [Moritella sp.]|uniref:YdcF family protein n=1 Tax=Moritella sp. TaxID=78556 RepID=UPI0029B2364A|nr:YdcF family protein [Moritella sp.]MDX2322003.1 YdcF family protein [Moritella sp.]